MSGHQLGVVEKIGYGFGDTASNIVFQVVLNFMVFFYTDVFGISASAVAILMLVVRIFDMITDPVMGGIADRTSTRWGKYRPYLIWVALPYCLLAVLAFTTPDLTSGYKLVYAYVTYALLMTAYTAINIPYGALGGVMTSDPSQRGEIQGYRFTLAMVGSLIVNSSLLKLAEKLGGDNQQLGFQWAMAVLSIIALICFVICFIATKERVPPENNRNETTLSETVKGIFQDFYQLVKCNHQWAIIAAITFFLLIIAVMRGGTTLYYAKYFLTCTNGGSIGFSNFSYNYCDSAELGTAILTIGTLAAILGAMGTIFLTRKFCKTTIFKFVVLSHIAVCTLQYFLPSTMISLTILIHSLGGVFHIMMISLVFAMTADSVDWGEFINGKRITAMTFSGHLFALKFGAAIGGLLLGWTLALFGYAEPVEGVDQIQSESSRQGILLLITLIPAFFTIICYLLIQRYQLTSKRLREIQITLSLRESHT